MRCGSRMSLIAAVLWAGCGTASAFVEISGVFIADDRCQALDSIRRETNPGNILTVPGQSYTARALNREDGDFVFLDVPNAAPRMRWVSVSCGELFRQAEEPQRPDEPAQPASGFTPFFDNDDKPNDPTPRPPNLNAFDRAMLEVCGDWGSNPREASFRSMLDDPKLSADVDRIFQALNGSVFGPPRDLPRFKDELASAWFDEGGFRHVFCGEPSGGTIGGLHFVGRYLQMQEQGWGGLGRCNRTEIAPPVYTFGVRYRIPRGGLRTACPKGYALNLDASEIIIEATRAFKLMLPRSSGKAMCLHQVAEANERPYLTVFVIKNRAIRTFFPDASPSCDGNRPPATCMCEG
jgi:Bacterial EndoU nuclease